MALGSELVFAVSREIGECFSQNRVRKIEARDSWLSVVFSRDRSLLFSWDAECCGAALVGPDDLRQLTAAAAATPPILNAVKSHVTGAELLSAVQLGRDRILKVTLRKTVGAGFHQTRHLILEAAGRYSNLILTDENDTILETAKHIHPDTNRFRSTLPGLPYETPPALGNRLLDDFEPSEVDPLHGLEATAGIGRPLLAALQAATAAGELSFAEIAAGLEMLKTLQGQPVYQAVGGCVTYWPTLLPGARRIEASGALEAAHATTVTPLLARRAEKYRRRIAARLAQSAQHHGKKIAEYEALAGDADAAERLMQTGRLILANLWQIPPRADSAELSEWTEAGERRVRVELDPAKDGTQNADRYFARYRKKRAAAERARRVLPQLYAARDEIEEQQTLLGRNTDVETLAAMSDELTPDKASPAAGAAARSAPPHRRFAFPDRQATIFCGLSAKGNHYVTFRLARPDDLWFHAQGAPGAHVVLRFEARPDDETRQAMIEIAATAAAYYSKLSGGGRVRVDYAERRHVRGIPGAGPAQVTYKEFGTVMADPERWPALAGEA